MAEDALELVKLRNNFYRDNYRKITGLLAFSLIIIFILTATLIYLIGNPPKPRYFATDSQGRLIQIPPLDEPNLSSAAVIQWTNMAIVGAFTFDFVNYRSQLQSISDYFTSEGWQAFIAALKPNLTAVTSKKLVASAVATGAPVVLQQGRLEGRYAWRIKMPMLITYSGTDVTQQNVIATILVVRVSTLTTPKGIAIAQLIITSSGSLDTF
jgi:intracellular multiplication protein IcmL